MHRWKGIIRISLFKYYDPFQILDHNNTRFTCIDTLSLVLPASVCFFNSLWSIPKGMQVINYFYCLFFVTKKILQTLTVFEVSKKHYLDVLLNHICHILQSSSFPANYFICGEFQFTPAIPFEYYFIGILFSCNRFMFQ